MKVPALLLAFDERWNSSVQTDDEPVQELESFARMFQAAALKLVTPAALISLAICRAVRADPVVSVMVTA